jgi:hypothetical protein
MILSFGSRQKRGDRSSNARNKADVHEGERKIEKAGDETIKKWTRSRSNLLLILWPPPLYMATLTHLRSEVPGRTNESKRGGRTRRRSTWWNELSSRANQLNSASRQGALGRFPLYHGPPPLEYDKSRSYYVSPQLNLCTGAMKTRNS